MRCVKGVTMTKPSGGEREEKLRETLQWALGYMPLFETEECRQKLADARALLAEPQPDDKSFVKVNYGKPPQQPAPPSLSALRSEMVRILGANTGLSFNQAMQGLNALWPLILSAAEPTVRDRVLEEAAHCVETQTVGGNKAPGSASRVLLVQAIRALKSQVSITGEPK